MNATANPSGRVDGAAYERLAGAIVDAVREGCDAILLDLHGAMVTERFDDGEGELLRRIRAVAPDTPLAVALDLHGNITRAMVEAADVIVGFKTYPHVDMFETGEHAARVLFDWLDGGPRPHVAWAQPPLLSHTLRSATGEGAMQRAVERARQCERDGLLAATVFAGFSLADFQDAGVSVVTVGRTRDEAQRAADELAQSIWRERDGFVYASAPLADSVAQARALHATRRRAPGAPARSRRQRHVGRNLRHHRPPGGMPAAGAVEHRRRPALRSGRRWPSRRRRAWARRWTSNSATFAHWGWAPIRARGCACVRGSAR